MKGKKIKQKEEENKERMNVSHDSNHVNFTWGLIWASSFCTFKAGAEPALLVFWWAKISTWKLYIWRPSIPIQHTQEQSHESKAW